MKVAHPIINILECHWRICLLAYIILATIFSTFVSADVSVYDKIENSYQKEKRNSPHSKPSSHLHKNNHKSRTDNSLISNGHADKSTNDKGSPELRRFLEDVLKAQKDFKWIDRAVYTASHEDARSPKSSIADSHMQGNDVDDGVKLRDKRGFDQRYESLLLLRKRKYIDENTDGIPRDHFQRNDLAFDTDVRHSDSDNLPRWLNLDENLERMSQKAHQGHDETEKSDSHDDTEKYLYPDFRMRDPRKSQTSLESLKNTVLALRKNLVEGDKKSNQGKKHVNNREHDKIRMTANRKGVSSSHAREGENNPQEAKRSSSVEDIDKRSNSWDDPSSSIEDSNFERDDGELRNHDDGEAEWKMRGTKEAKINSEQKEGNVKLFHRAGFGESYPEEKNLEESRERERRSKGSPLTEDRYSNEHPDKDKLENHEINLISKPSLFIASRIDDIHRTGEENSEAQINPYKTNEVFNSESNTNALDYTDKNQAGNIHTNIDIADNKDVYSNNPKEDSLKNMDDKNTEAKQEAEENHRQSYMQEENDSPRKRRRKRPMKSEAGDGNLDGDSSRISGFTTNESRAASTEILGNSNYEKTSAGAGIQGTKENCEDLGSMEKERPTFEPQEHFYECERKVQKTKLDKEERRKVPQKIMDEKRGEEVPKNLTFLLKSENRDVIEVSGANEDRGIKPEESGTLVLNSVDVRKKTIMKESSRPGNSVSTIIGIKIEKAQIGSSTNSGGNQDRKDFQEGDKPFANNTVNDSDLQNAMDFDNNKKYVKMVEDEQREETAGKQSNLIKKMKTLDDNTNSDIENSSDSENPNKDSSRSSDAISHKNKIPETNNVMLNDIRPMDSSCTQRRLLWTSSIFTNDKEDIKNVNFSSVNDNIPKIFNNTSDRKFINTNCTDESRFVHGYAKSKRRLLESNSDKVDVEKQDDDDWSESSEDAAESYDEEEDELNDGENEKADVERQERSLDNPRMDPIKAKVDVLIQQKLSLKNKERGGYMRKRRNPLNTIEYYDYDNEVDEQDLNPTVLSNKEKRITDGDRDFIDSQMRLDFGENAGCKLGQKKNEQADEILKEQREKAKLKHKEPKEEFIGDQKQSAPKNETGKDEKSSSPSSALLQSKFESERKLLEEDKSRKLDQGEENTNDINHGRLEGPRVAMENFPVEKKRGASNGKTKIISEKSLEYVLRAQSKVDSVGDFLQDIAPLKAFEDLQILQTPKDTLNNPKMTRVQDDYLKEMEKSQPNNIDTIYDDSENVPDWNDSEMKYRPRLRGDQRTHFENNAKSEMQNFQTVSNNIGSLKREDVDLSPTFSVQASIKEQPEEVAETEINNTFAMNKTKCPKTHANHQNRFKEVNPNFAQDSQVYLEPAFPEEVIPHKNLGGQTDFGSKDLHESFVEPLDWFDDFDDDVKIRLGRSLKSIEASAPLELAKWKNTRSVPDWYNSTSSQIFLGQNNGNSFGLENVTNNNLTNKLDTVNISNRVRREISDIYRDKNRVEMDAPDNYKYSINNLQLDYNFPRSKIVETSRANDYRAALNLDRLNEDRYRVNLKNKRDQRGNSRADRILDLKKKNKHRKGKKKKHSSKPLGKHVKKKRLNTLSHLHPGDRRNRRHKHYAVLKGSRTRDRLGNHALNQERKSKRLSSHYVHPSGVKKSHSKKKKHSTRTTKDENLNGDSRIANKEVILQSSAQRHTAKFEDDAQRRKIAMLLTADDPEDESQMDSALHGELAGSIVDKIFQQVQNNEGLKVALGPGLYRKHKPEEAVTADKIYRKALDEDEVKHTEDLMKRVMDLLGRLILDEVQRKTCVSLSPDLQVFLEWILGVGQKRQGPAASLLRDEEAPGHREDQKFLFNDSPDEERDAEIDELHKKIRVMESLIEEYNALTEREKTRVRSVHEYLIKQLDTLLKYIETREGDTARSLSRTGASRRKIGTSLRQQEHYNGTLNRANTEYIGDYHGDNREVRRYVRSSNGASRLHSKRKRHGKRKKKHRKRQKGKSSVGPSSMHRMQVHKELQPRRKRANSDEDLSDNFNSAYQKPMIYNSLEITNVRPTEDTVASVKQGFEEMTDKGKENYWEEVFAHKPGTDRERNIEGTSRNRPLTAKSRMISTRSGAPQIWGKQRSSRISTSGVPFHSLGHGNGVIDQHHALERQRAIHRDKGQNAVHKCLMNHNVNMVNRCGADGGCRDDHRADRNGQNVRDGRSSQSNDEYPSNYVIKKREIPRSSGVSKQVRRTSERNDLFDNPSHDVIECKGKGKKEAEIKVPPTLAVLLNVSNNEEGVLPIKGKNQVEDEVILLNKREAWRRENEKQLEEVAFGKDMSKRMGEKELFERLTEIDKKKNINGTNAAEKREDNKQYAEENTLLPFGLLPKVQNDFTSTTSVGIINLRASDKKIHEDKTRTNDPKNIAWKNCKASDDNCHNSNTTLDDERVRILEKMTNVYPDIEQSTATV